MTKQNKTEKYDVIVIGAGTSGLMAAINAAQQGVRVLVVDKNPKPGRKLLLSGGARCNVTNRTTRENLIKHIPGNGKFLYGALNQFDQEDIVEFFESRGIELKEEDHGRMFPVTNKSRTILNALLDELEKYDVTLKLNSPVERVLYDLDEKKVTGIETKAGEMIGASSIVLAVGGKAYPKTGSTGDGYGWAKAAGHNITHLYPTEAPLLSDDEFIKEKVLQGVALRDVNVTVWDEQDKAVVEHRMDMIFTHFGFSGPAILRCSGHVNQFLDRTKASEGRLSIDLTPDLNQEDLKEEAESQREKQVLTIMKKWMPERTAEVICQFAGIEPAQPYKQLVHDQVSLLMHYIKAFPLTAYGSQPIEKGFVTGGGVDIKEVTPQTMESKLMQGLYFCGELLDVNGYTGGYNITSAFVTGTVAGQHAAWGSFG